MTRNEKVAAAFKAHTTRPASVPAPEAGRKLRAALKAAEKVK
ncbi:hypothetical protein [Streptomyces sp. NPDC006638]